MPLNRELYEALKKVFKHVKISKANVPMTASYYPDHEGRLRLRPIENGEYYRISCPYCHDTNFHLYINHRWGVRDSTTGMYNHHLAVCFHSGCLRDEENRDDLVERLDLYNIAAEADGISLEPVERGDGPVLRPVDLPEDYVRLAALKKGHPARRYLRKRGFDLDLLSQERAVGYSRRGCDWWPAGRVIIPLTAYVEGHGWCTVGWQARAIKPAEKIKYYTLKNTPKSQILYGLEAVEGDASPVLICEGAIDVWKAGENAVALLGKDISSAQQKLVRECLADRPLVVMLDPEAEAEAKEVAVRIDKALDLSLLGRDEKSRVVVARLPDERDPGDCTREEIWKAARAALARGAKKKRR